ncbi:MULTISPECIES: hypothetical protein [unclassified Microcoleus]|uniref:hypothetical protein n=1 Tax=unclassified Microcoleus TaxID=2642155 RepID=UPI002FCF93CF
MMINPLTAFTEVLRAFASRRSCDRVRGFQGSVLLGFVSIASGSKHTGLII